MSSVSFALPSWPNVVEDDVLYHKIIIWILCGLFMLICPIIIIYYFYGLNKLRFLMALRRRHFKLLKFLFIVILMDFIIIEPIRLLFGTYLRYDILYWIYFILSITSTQIILYILLLKIWLLFYDIKWIKICCIDDNQWRYHINNTKQKINHNNHEHNNQQTKNGKIKQIGIGRAENIELQNVDEHKDIGIDDEHFEEQQHPNIEQANSQINKKTNSDLSWFVKHKQSLGNIQYIYKYFIIITIISIILSM